MPDAVNLTVSDPLSADIQAVCRMLEAAFAFLTTPEGQASLKQARENWNAFEAGCAQAFAKVAGLLK